jgi:hypothetical protein
MYVALLVVYYFLSLSLTSYIMWDVLQKSFIMRQRRMAAHAPLHPHVRDAFPSPNMYQPHSQSPQLIPFLCFCKEFRGFLQRLLSSLAPVLPVQCFVEHVDTLIEMCFFMYVCCSCAATVGKSAYSPVAIYWSGMAPVMGRGRRDRRGRRCCSSCFSSSWCLVDRGFLCCIHLCLLCKGWHTV